MALVVDGLEQHHGLGPARGLLLVPVDKGEGDAVLVVGEPAGDEPRHEGRERHRHLLGRRVVRGAASVVGDRLGRPSVERLDMFGIGLGDGPVREGEADARVGDGDVDCCKGWHGSLRLMRVSYGCGWRMRQNQ